MSSSDIAIHIGDLYADTLYELAEENSILEQVCQEMQMLETLIEQNHEFLDIMSSPQFSAEYKKSLVQKMFSGKVSDLMLHFLLEVHHRNRMIFFPQIIANFNETWDAHHGISFVELTLHQNPGSDELTKIVSSISQAMGKQVELKLNIRPAIMGGAVIRYGESVIDNSIRSRLFNAVRTVMENCKQIRIKDEIQYQ